MMDVEAELGRVTLPPILHRDNRYREGLFGDAEAASLRRKKKVHVITEPWTRN